MKKILLIAALILLIIKGFAQTTGSIYFISPIKSTVWKAGTTDTIKIDSNNNNEYECAVYYQKEGGSMNFFGNIYNTGESLLIWDINYTLLAGKYNIVLYDYYSSQYYYSDTFTINAADPKIKIVTPFNGLNIQSGKSMNIQWSSVYKDSINIELSLNNGLNWDTLAHNQVVSAYSYKICIISIPKTTNKKGILKITNYNNTLSDSIIINLTNVAEFKFTSPTDTSKWMAGSDVDIEFSTTDSLSKFWYLNCYKVGNDTSSILSYNYTQIGLINLYLYIDPIVDSGKYYLQIYDSYTGQSSFSDTFHITPATPVLTINSPTSNYYLLSGEKFNLFWSSISINNIFVVFSKDGGTSWDTLATNISSPNSYNNSALIKAPVVSSTYLNCILRIGSFGKSAISLISPITLSDVSPYQFITPVKNTIWTADSTYTVQFNSSKSDFCEIYYQKLDSNNNNYNFLTEIYSSSGLNSFTWQIDQYTDSGYYRLAIYDYTYDRYFYSDTFYISPAPPSLTITAPSSNYYLVSGEKFSLNWSAVNSGPINVLWSKNGGSTWDTMAVNVNSPNSNYNYDTASIKVPKVSTTYHDCLLKIVNNAQTAFSIVMNIIISNNSPYQFIAPSDTTRWVAGSTVTVKFYNMTTDDWELNYKMIGSYANFIDWGSQNGSVNYSWDISPYLDSGYYQMAIYDETFDRFYYSDTFYIAQAPPSLTLTSPQSGYTIFSGGQFYIDWSAVNSGNINVEISEDGGTSWDTIARNIYSYNNTFNSYQVSAPIFKDATSIGILKISNLSNTAYSIISGLTFSNKAPYDFIYPTNQTIAYAGTSIQIEVRNNIMDYNYLYFDYEKVGGYDESEFNDAYSGDSIISLTWNIPQNIDTGKYQIFFYDYSLGQEFYSDTFTIAPEPSSLTLISPQSGYTIYSGSQFYIDWSAVNSGNINIEISEEDGASWDTIARNIYSYNDSNNSHQVTAPIFSKVYTNGILKISNVSNTLFSEVSNLTFVASTSISTISQIEYFNAYPNPFNSKLVISYELLNQSKVEIGIYDLLGKYVETVYSGFLPEGKQQNTIDVSELQSGVYILQMKTPAGISKLEIVKK
jgi:hypothetical protein